MCCDSACREPVGSKRVQPNTLRIFPKYRPRFKFALPGEKRDFTVAINNQFRDTGIKDKIMTHPVTTRQTLDQTLQAVGLDVDGQRFGFDVPGKKSKDLFGAGILPECRIMRDDQLSPKIAHVRFNAKPYFSGPANGRKAIFFLFSTANSRGAPGYAYKN